MDSFNCPVTVTTHIIGGKWKPSILFYLQGRIRRFSELQKLLSGPTKKMMSAWGRKHRARHSAARI